MAPARKPRISIKLIEAACAAMPPTIAVSASASPFGDRDFQT
jgi:hypothetical protein